MILEDNDKLARRNLSGKLNSITTQNKIKK